MPTWQVGASSDDCERTLGNDQWDTDGSVVEVGNEGVGWSQRGSGMRFTNITIPQGATIDSAYLTLQSQGNQSGTTVNSRISAEDVDDAATFSTAADFDTRYAARTTARVDWDAIAAWSTQVDYNSPEIKTVIQEIVDRAGWVSGNDLVIFWEDFDNRSSSGAYRQGNSYDWFVSQGAPIQPPKLVIVVFIPQVFIY